jgi:(S)-2-hydroxy-acid oxidase
MLVSANLSLSQVYTAEDVELAISHGLDGVIISNHGGRQMDGVPATLDALRECAPVAAGHIAIAIDGGIRRGSDIFKAIALGAQHCFVGRVPIWGLAVCTRLHTAHPIRSPFFAIFSDLHLQYNGEKGVALAISLLLEEFRLAMALSG